MKYKQITLSTTSEFSELAAYAFSEQGSEGVAIRDAADIRTALMYGADYPCEIAQDGIVTVTGFFDVDFCPEKLEELLQSYSKGFNAGAMELNLSIIDSADWENEWKKYYSPIEIGGAVVVPKWLDGDYGDKIKILIDPGMAFGTGNHETTSLCLALLQQPDLKGKRVADVGAGSGILGIAALKLGSKSCTFVDVDPLAVEAAKANCALNGVTEKAEFVLGSLLTHTEEQFDTVVANITADVLLMLCEQLKDRLKPGGTVILSGIIHARGEQVRKAYERYFELEPVFIQGEWQAYRGVKRG